MSGAYVTLVSPDGAGFVRLANPKLEGLLSNSGMPGNKFDYVEHITTGLGPITYYGESAK